jgi:hypothetical protein
VVSQHDQASGGMSPGVVIGKDGEFSAMAWGSSEHFCTLKEELVHFSIVP